MSSASDPAAAAASSAAALSSVPPMLLLSEAAVARALSMADAIHINGQAFLAAHIAATAAASASGSASAAAAQTQVPAYAAIAVASDSKPEVKDVTLFKPALMEQALGCKVVAVRPNNADAHLPTVPAVILLTDRHSGFPLALVQATYLTALRTAAGSGVATDCFASAEARVLAVWGAGMQAEQHVHAVLAVRPAIRCVHIVNRSAARAQELVATLQQRYPAVQFTVHATSDSSPAATVALSSALRSSHVICTTTNSCEALLKATDVSPGAHINAIGSYLPSMHELDSALVARARIVVDTAPAAFHSGDLHSPIQAGLIEQRDIKELGAYLDRDKYSKPLAAAPSSASTSAASPTEAPSAGGEIGFTLDLSSLPSASASAASAPLSRSASDITIFKSVGTAIQDVATAYAVLQRARSMGMGRTAVWD